MLLLLFADDGTKPEKATGKMRRTPRTGQSRGGPGDLGRTAAGALGHAPCCIWENVLEPFHIGYWLYLRSDIWVLIYFLYSLEW